MIDFINEVLPFIELESTDDLYDLAAAIAGGLDASGIAAQGRYLAIGQHEAKLLPEPAPPGLSGILLLVTKAPSLLYFIAEPEVAS